MYSKVGGEYESNQHSWCEMLLISHNCSCVIFDTNVYFSVKGSNDIGFCISGSKIINCFGSIMNNYADNSSVLILRVLLTTCSISNPIILKYASGRTGVDNLNKASTSFLEKSSNSATISMNVYS